MRTNMKVASCALGLSLGPESNSDCEIDVVTSASQFEGLPRFPSFAILTPQITGKGGTKIVRSFRNLTNEYGWNIFSAFWTCPNPCVKDFRILDLPEPLRRRFQNFGLARTLASKISGFWTYPNPRVKDFRILDLPEPLRQRFQSFGPTGAICNSGIWNPVYGSAFVDQFVFYRGIANLVEQGFRFRYCK